MWIFLLITSYVYKEVILFIIVQAGTVNENKDLSFFYLTNTRLLKRIDECKAIYKSVLSKPFDFNLEESINTDYENQPYAKNDKGCFMANFKPNRGDYAADGALYTVEAESYETKPSKSLDNRTRAMFVGIADPNLFVPVEPNFESAIQTNQAHYFDNYVSNA